jgi:hypothetical protein
VPVVVAGPKVLDPYEPYATVVLDRRHDVVEACERAASEPLRPHSNAAAHALRDVLARRGLDAAPIVDVRRRYGVLFVEVRRADALDDATKSMASVRMTAAIRAFDRDARGIDVVFLAA